MLRYGSIPSDISIGALQSIRLNAAGNAFEVFEAQVAGNYALTSALSAYALLGHDHAGVYQPIGSYSLTSHNHAGVYSPVAHDHTGVYQPVGSYLVAADIASFITISAFNGVTLNSSGDGLSYLANDGTYKVVVGGGGSWGTITGTITDQTDLITKFAGYALSSSLSSYATITSLGTGAFATIADYATIASLSGYQTTLISGTNIKTINGQSVIGSGDIEITSGGLTYSAINSSQAITNGNYYGVTCTGDIILTLADGTSIGQNLSIKKLDNTAYTITITGNIEGETSIVMDTQYESLDLFWNGTYYLIK